MEITPSKLRAMAGWALSRISGSSPAQANALHKFKDGCGELAENYPEHVEVSAPLVKPQVLKESVTETARPGRFSVSQPELVSYVETGVPQSCEDAGEHRFDIHTQRCVFCSRSYREVRGRHPELMR